MAPLPRFYTLTPSHYCVSVDRALAFKGISVERVNVPYHDKRRLLRETGQDYVPALRWDGRVVTWKEIPRFLDRAEPQPLLFPRGKEGVAGLIESWAHEVLEERVWRAVVTEVPPFLGSDFERWSFEEMQTRARGPWHVLRARRAEYRRDLLPYFGMIERLLTEREWVLDVPSIADFGLYGGLWGWLLVGRPIPRAYPRLASWVERIRRIRRPR